MESSCDRRCGVPETMGRTTRFPISPCIELGLQCPLSCPRGGELLPHHFTLTRLSERFIFCCTGRKLVLMQASLVFTRNSVLRCPDFPLFGKITKQRMTTSRKLINAGFIYLSTYTILPHWSHWVSFCSTRTLETTSLETFKWHPVHCLLYTSPSPRD